MLRDSFPRHLTRKHEAYKEEMRKAKREITEGTDYEQSLANDVGER
jgi:hypothetical protein